MRPIDKMSTTTRNQKPDDVAQSAIDHFTAIPFLQPTLRDPDFIIISHPRETTHDGKGHTLMGKTWNSEGTIQELLNLFRYPEIKSSEFPQPEAMRPETRRFYTLGGDLNAHPDLMHGGVIGCILDSTLGNAIGGTLRYLGIGHGNSMFTVQLNITYKKPVRTPGTIMARGWVVKMEDGGRKVWAQGVIEGEGGVVHALAEGMWTRPKNVKL